jgi:hypothetical protein
MPFSENNNNSFIVRKVGFGVTARGLRTRWCGFEKKD